MPRSPPVFVWRILLVCSLLTAAPVTVTAGTAADATHHLPLLEPVWESPHQHAFNHLATFEGGLEFVYYNASYPASRALWRLDDTGLHEVAPQVHGPTTRTAEGALVHHGSNGDRPALLMKTEDGAVPLVHESRLVGFGPDGAFYSWAYRPFLSLQRLTEAREATEVLSLRGYGIDEVRAVWAPDGRLLVHARGDIFFLDVTTGMRSPAADGYRGVQAFDEQGRGYHVPWPGFAHVVRYDPVTDEHAVVAAADRRIGGIALAGSRLFATLGEALPEPGMGPSRSALASAPIDAVGFGGFHPTFDPAPLPDLMVTSFEDENRGPAIFANGSVVAEDHMFRIRVSNVGMGPAAASELLVRQAYRPSSALFAGCLQEWRVRVPPINAGASVVLEVAWQAKGNGLGCPGDHTFYAMADNYFQGQPDLVEADETNNWATTTGYLLVEGNRAACREAVGATLGDEEVLLNQRPDVICRLLFGDAAEAAGG